MPMSYYLVQVERDMLKLTAVQIPVNELLTMPIQREHRSRRGQLYTIHDTVTNTAIIAQKLTDAAIHLNHHYAYSRLERVSARGLYEAANKQGGHTNGLHKMRFRVSRCDLTNAKSALEDVRGL
eukprot:1529914-Prymnesium_polylepis.1